MKKILIAGVCCLFLLLTACRMNENFLPIWKIGESSEEAEMPASEGEEEAEEAAEVPEEEPIQESEPELPPEEKAAPEPEPEPEPEPMAKVLGKEYSLDTVFLNLPSDRVHGPEDLKGIEELPALQEVDLTGIVRSPEEMDAIMKAFPRVTFFFRCAPYGVEATGYDEELDLSGKYIGDFEELRAWLQYFPRLQKLIVCDCGRTNEELAAFRDTIPEIKLVWRLYLHGGFYTLRTDDIAFSTLYTGEDPNVKMGDWEVQPLRYCTDLQALDLGHMQLYDISFLEDLPNLKVLILADNRIWDLSPLAKLTQLTYLEVFMNYNVQTLEPLSHLCNLRDLNISYLWAPRDYEYLYGLTNLQRLWINQCQITPEERQGLEENMPSSCEVHISESESSTGGGWRDGSDIYWAQFNMFRGNYIDDIFLP